MENIFGLRAGNRSPPLSTVCGKIILNISFLDTIPQSLLSESRRNTEKRADTGQEGFTNPDMNNPGFEEEGDGRVGGNYFPVV